MPVPKSVSKCCLLLSWRIVKIAILNPSNEAPVSEIWVTLGLRDIAVFTFPFVERNSRRKSQRCTKDTYGNILPARKIFLPVKKNSFGSEGGKPNTEQMATNHGTAGTVSHWLHMQNLNHHDVHYPYSDIFTNFSIGTSNPTRRPNVQIENQNHLFSKEGSWLSSQCTILPPPSPESQSINARHAHRNSTGGSFACNTDHPLSVPG